MLRLEEFMEDGREEGLFQHQALFRLGLSDVDVFGCIQDNLTAFVETRLSLPPSFESVFLKVPE